MNWNEIEEGIKRCKKCEEEGFYNVKCPDERVPTSEPRNVKLLFVSEAPPLNGRSYFYHENANDRLRNSLFELLRTDLGYEIRTINDFIAAGFFLLPTVKCPSAWEARNTAPAERVIALCAEQHLKREIEHIKPDGVCLLGRTALHGFFRLCNRWGMYNAVDVRRTLSESAGTVLTMNVLDNDITFVISYWPTRRHRRFHEISEHIRVLMGALGLFI
jgi:uracil-DNA glycosylase